jgi:hypothetical protein
MKQKKKHGQITIFIIIAIVIVVLIGIILIIFNNNPNSNNNSNDEGYILINDCLKQTGEQALNYIGNSGGYYYVPDKSTDYGTPYYFYLGENLIPLKEKIENETSRFIDDRGNLCGFFDNSQFSVISRGNVSTKTKIYDDRIVMDIKYPITVEKSNRKISYENFNIEIPGRVGILYKSANDYINGQVENPGGICISCINDIANKYDVKFITYNYDNETVIFSIVDEKTKINNQSFYVYSFAVKYDPDMNNVSI